MKTFQSLTMIPIYSYPLMNANPALNLARYPHVDFVFLNVKSRKAPGIQELSESSAYSKQMEKSDSPWSGFGIG